MKRFLLYFFIGIGSLLGIFALIVAATLIIADNEVERQRISYNLGYAYGMFLFIAFIALVIYGVFRLLFVKKQAPEEQPVDKDAPIDRYLK